jgi:hypothetical protein
MAAGREHQSQKPGPKIASNLHCRAVMHARDGGCWEHVACVPQQSRRLGRDGHRDWSTTTHVTAVDRPLPLASGCRLSAFRDNNHAFFAQHEAPGEHVRFAGCVPGLTVCFGVPMYFCLSVSCAVFSPLKAVTRPTLSPPLPSPSKACRYTSGNHALHAWP